MIARLSGSSFRDLLPIVIVIGLFQGLVLREPLEQLGDVVTGLFLVVLGLSLFVLGLELGLFPLGERMAYDFARKGNVALLLAFAFALGFGTTFAEPALIVVADKAAELAVMPSGGEIGNDGDAIERIETLRSRHALGLRTTVALAVGFALMVGVIRILTGWPLHHFIMVGYAAILLLTVFAPDHIIAVAYDSGGVTTSTITVPLTAALGIGLASSIRGRDPLSDGFGLIAMASLMPILFVLAWGIIRQ